MAKVHLLEDSLINKIAAGEVVERPASVLKELVENAIDAGANTIEVSLVEGGRRKIVVRDNGLGMSNEDAKLAVKRHCTSKIANIQDLFEVGTMGFRGEALASISSVSRFLIQTKERGSAMGTKLEFVDGQILEMEWNGEPGTQVTVEDLFYNVPARLAFLKSGATEYAYGLEYLQALALAHPEIEFVLRHNDKEVLRTTRISDHMQSFWGEDVLKKRFQEVFPKEDLQALIYVKTTDKYGSFEALLSPPGYEKAHAKTIFTFVNGRWVKDKVLRYGVMRGYHSHILKNKYPTCLLYVRLDPSLVDVNVHPAKTEVRFQYGNELQSLLALSIREKLRQGAWARPESPRSLLTNENSIASLPTETEESNHLPYRNTKATIVPPVDFDLSFSDSKPTFAKAGTNFQPNATRDDGTIKGSRAPSRAAPFSHSSEVKRTIFSFDGVEQELAQYQLNDNDKRTGDDRSDAVEHFAIPWDDLEYLGTFGKCYLMFEFGDQLLVIDQHAFHERILFEKLTRDQSMLQQIQPLLVPEVISLSPSSLARLKEFEAQYKNLGFNFKILNDQEIELLGVPALLAKRDPESLIADLVKVEVSDNSYQDTAQLAHHLLATMACHAAVRAGELLSRDDIAQFLKQAKDVDFYHNCPHGRRVLKWWRRSEVESWFDR